MKDCQILIITSRFNEDITDRMCQGAYQTLVERGLPEQNVTRTFVPGAFELPVVAAKAAETGKWDAILCLGALIEGDTDHYHYICDAVANGIMKVSIDYRTPVLFGVLTTKTREQAIQRSSLENLEREVGKEGKQIIHNKGSSVAESALETLETMGALDEVV